jgi:hypothetical protein
MSLIGTITVFSYTVNGKPEMKTWQVASVFEYKKIVARIEKIADKDSIRTTTIE